MIIKFIALAILIEALVELFFKAAPLQPIRAWLIKKMPWLKSNNQGHMLDCKYCCSVWIGTGVFLMATFADYDFTRLAGGALIVARCSNHLHVLISAIRDIQINMRLER